VFPEGTTATSIHLQKLMLFLTVAAVTAASCDEQLGVSLSRLVQQAYADNVLLRANKSLEPIQTTLVITD